MITALPKIELHLHLEGAAPPGFIRGLAKEKHIDLAGQDLSALAGHFCFGFVQGVLLHVHQHQVHAEFGPDAGAFQTKSGTGTGQDSGFAFEVVNHGETFFNVNPTRGK